MYANRRLIKVRKRMMKKYKKILRIRKKWTKLQKLHMEKKAKVILQMALFRLSNIAPKQELCKIWGAISGFGKSSFMCFVVFFNGAKMEFVLLDWIFSKIMLFERSNVEECYIFTIDCETNLSGDSCDFFKLWFFMCYNDCILRATNFL